MSSSGGMWQRIACLASASLNGGSSVSQIRPILRGQRL